MQGFQGINPLENLALCLYALCEGGHLYSLDCIPDALQALHEASAALGIKIRGSTIQSLLNYVRGVHELSEIEAEELVKSVADLLAHRGDPQHSKAVIQRIMRIALGHAINMSSGQALLEVGVAALHALFVRTLYEAELGAVQEALPEVGHAKAEAPHLVSAEKPI